MLAPIALVAGAIFGSLASAAPAPVLAGGVASAAASAAVAAPAKPAPVDVASCSYAQDVAGGYGLDGSVNQNAWTVVIPTDSAYDNGGCGKGFFDNIGGVCPTFNSPSCNLATDGTATLTFVADPSCDGGKITGAIHAASYGKLNTACTAQ